MAYIITPAPGCFGDTTQILYRVETLAEARRLCRGNPRRAIWEADEHDKVGDTWHHRYEHGYRRVKAAPDERPLNDWEHDEVAERFR